jgi:hypothetical protein
MSHDEELRVMLVSMVPPRNDCGVRIVMYRHLVERSPFQLHVVSHADFADDLKIDTRLTLPGPIQRLRKSRFGPFLSKSIHDFENHLWARTIDQRLQNSIDQFKPQVILTLAETGLCHMAARAAKKNNIPLAGLFLDWFPIMPPHFGHKVFQGVLSARYRKLYRQCDLAICTSDGMMEVLGPHSNSHVIYPMPGIHRIPDQSHPPRTNKFRVVYVGAAQSFYGRMLRALLDQIRHRDDMELIIVGPTNDWPAVERERAQAEGILLGFMPPDKAAEVSASADALLVVMSFESEHELFMRTSFTTKWLDYVGFEKPVIVWGPNYCTPSRLALRQDAAAVVDTPDPADVISAMQELLGDREKSVRYSAASVMLSQNCFNPDRLQEILVTEMKKLSRG